MLDVEAKLIWDPPVAKLDQAPMSLCDDGGVVYFK